MTEPIAHVTHEREVAEERWGDIVAWRTLISGDRTPTKGLTVGVAEIQPGAPTRGARHRHPVPEVYHVITGRGQVRIDGVDHPVEAGSTVFIPANAWHHVINIGDEVLRLLYVFPVDRFDQVRYEHADEDVSPASAVPPAPR